MKFSAQYQTRELSVDVRTRRAGYCIRVHENNQFVEHPDLPEIIFNNGKIIVGGIPILAPRIAGDQVTWRQKTATSYCAGYLYLQHGGLNLHGSVTIGSTAEDSDTHAVVGTAITPVVYSGSITKVRYAHGTDPEAIPTDAWTEGLDLAISYDVAIGETIPQPKVSLDGQDVSMYTVWSVDSAGNTTLSLALDEIICQLAPTLYSKASISFNPYEVAPHGSGTVQSICSDTTTPTDVFLWKAIPRTVNGSVSVRADVLKLSATDMLGDGALSINELFTIVPDDNVNTAAQDMVMRNMKWAMGQDDEQNKWLNQYLGQQAPVITEPGQLKVAQQSVTWYQQNLALGYLTKAFQGYSGPNEPTDNRLSPDQEATLNQWFKTGLAKSPDFSVQQKGVFIDAFRATDPRLNDYLADGGEKWADTLYSALTAPQQLIIMVNRIAGIAGDPRALVPLNNFSCLLTALAPDGDHASKYYGIVLTGIINKLVPTSVHTDKDSIMQWLPTVLQQLLNSFATNGVPEEANITKQEAQDMAECYAKDSLEIASAVADMIANIGLANLISQSQKAEDGFTSIAAKWPRMAKLGKCMFALLWMGSVASIISTLAQGGWKNMNDVQKATFITQIVQASLQAFEAVPAIFNGVKNIAIATWEKFVSAVSDGNQLANMNAVADNISEDQSFVRAAGEEIEPLISSAEAASASGLARIFAEGMLSGIVKIFGVVAAAAMAAYSLWQLIKDVKSHGSISTIVFDSLIFAANLASVACMALALVSTSVVIPIAGAVLAIVGVILSIIATYKEKPDNPVDDWMRDHGQPFVNSIQLPPTPSALLGRNKWSLT